RGQLLVSATGSSVVSSRGDLTLWDMDSARVVRKASTLASVIDKVRFSPDGRRLATAGWDRVGRYCDATTLNELLPLPGHAGHVKCVAFSPDGNLLASGGDEGSLR